MDAHPLAAPVDLPAPAEPIPASDRRVLPALCASAFVATMVFIAPAPFFPVMADDLDVGVPLLGQVIAAMLLLSAVLGLVVGPLADRYGHRRLIVLGLLAAAISLMTFGLAPTFPVLLAGSLAGGLADAALLGPIFAVAGTYFAGAAARQALGWTTACMAGSAIIGVPLIAAVGDVVGWRAAFVATGLVAAGIAGLAAAWLPHDAHRPVDRLRARALLAAYRPLLGHGPMLRLYGSSILRAFCWFGMLTYFGAFLGEDLGLSTRDIGFTYMLGGAGYFLGSLLAGGPLSRVPARVLLAGGNVAMALLMGLAFSGVLGTAGTIAVMPLATFTGALGWIGLTTLLTAETPAGAGTTMTLNGSLFNLGAAGGGAVGGLLLSLGGYGALALGLPVFGLASALLARPAPRA
ncbi:MAG: MFS transporter [Chloroflexia bacterium]|nr:MFS transporter [Chloroflexia bacterium]